MAIRIGDLGILFTAAGVRSLDLSASPPPPPPPPPPPEGLTPSWLVEYVDTAGVRQRTPINNDGSTSITIRQYANVTFDARASRSTSTGCSTAGGAAQLMGYGINYGEALGGVWSTSGFSRDVDQGPPIFSRCYTVTGARTVSLYVRDPDGRESTVTCTVNVQALGSVVDISSGGSWPTWASNTVYGLAAGGDYTSRGNIVLSGLTGVRIIKTGSGADPIVAAFRPETRGVTAGSPITNRSKDCVLVNIDYTRYEAGTIGVDYCGSYGGRCRYYGSGEILPLNFAWENSAVAANDATAAANIKYSRGVFIVAGGEINGLAADGGQYCLLGGSRSMNFAGTPFVRRTGDTGGNPIRCYMDSTVLRHVQIYSTTPCTGNIKGSLYPNIYAATPTDPWPEDDSFGDFALSRTLFLANGGEGTGAWGVGPKYFWVCDSVIGGPGGFEPTNFIGGWNPQNNATVTTGLVGPWSRNNCYESADTGGFERNRLTYNAPIANLTLSGRDLSSRNNTQLSGAAWGLTTNSDPARTHPDYLGPYHTTARPVHSALA